MSAYTDIVIFAGEKKPIYATVTAITGTVAYVSAFFTLYNSAGAALAGLTNVAATGSSGSGTAQITAFYNLDTGSGGAGGLLAAGPYRAVFAIQVTGSDNVTRNEEICFNLYLRSPA